MTDSWRVIYMKGGLEPLDIGSFDNVTRESIERSFKGFRLEFEQGICRIFPKKAEIDLTTAE